MRHFLRYLLLCSTLALLSAWAGGLTGLPAFLVGALAVVLAAALLTRWTLRPWLDLQKALERLRAGDFGARMDDVSPGSLARVGRAFNEMVLRLAESWKLAKDREDRFLAVLAASDRGILVVDLEGAVTLASPVTQSLFPNFRPDAGLVSLGLPGISQMVEEALATGNPQIRGIQESERGLGRLFSVRVTPIQHQGVVLYLRNVTSERELERVKADLVANVSHELRTPLTALTSLSDALSDTELPPDKRAHFMERLQAQIHRMQALVDDLLSLSRLEEEEVSLKIAPLAVGPFCRDVVTSLQPLAESSRVRLEAECETELSVETDRLLLEAALRNLLDNAIRYNRPDGRVTVKVEPQNGAIAISVADTGEGIPGSHLPRIFERFYRVDPHRSREKGGTGLGLAIVKHAVGRLGGEVRVESAVGTGSTFTVTLPRVFQP